MKKVYLLITLCLIIKASFGQGTEKVGQAQFNVGVGLSEYGTPVYVGFDYGAMRNLTIGGELSFRSYDEYWGQNYYRRNITGLAANANYHFNSILLLPSKFDFYAGLNLGFYDWSSPEAGYEGDHSSGLGVGLQVGGRYFFTRKFGMNLEFGGGNEFSGGKVGLTFKL